MCDTTFSLQTDAWSWTFQRPDPTGVLRLFPACSCPLLLPASPLIYDSSPAFSFTGCLGSFWLLSWAPPRGLGLDFLHSPCYGTPWILLDASSQPCPSDQHSQKRRYVKNGVYTRVKSKTGSGGWEENTNSKVIEELQIWGNYGIWELRKAFEQAFLGKRYSRLLGANQGGPLVTSWGRQLQIQAKLRGVIWSLGKAGLWLLQSSRGIGSNSPDERWHHHGDLRSQASVSEGRRWGLKGGCIQCFTAKFL